MLKAHEIPNLRHIKADPDVIEEFYRSADAQGWVLGETLAQTQHPEFNQHIAEGAGRGVRLTLFREAQAARGFQAGKMRVRGEISKTTKFTQSLTQLHIFKMQVA
jgi:hypothetical protein